MTNDVNSMVEPLRAVINGLLANSLMLFGGLGMCVVTSWKLSLLAFTAVGPIMCITGAGVGVGACASKFCGGAGLLPGNCARAFTRFMGLILCTCLSRPVSGLQSQRPTDQHLYACVGMDCNPRVQGTHGFLQ